MEIIWKHFENTGNPIPRYLINNLELMGYTSCDILAEVEANEIATEITTFVKDTLEAIQPTNHENAKNYFGPMFGQDGADRSKFIIVPGHKRLLKMLLEHCKEVQQRNAKDNIQKSRTLLKAGRSASRGEIIDDANTIVQEVTNLLKQYITNKQAAEPECWNDVSAENLEITNVENDKPVLKCLMCTERIQVCRDLGRRGYGRWIISNYTRHLCKHFYISESTGASSAKKKRKKSIKTESGALVKFHHVTSEDVAESPISEGEYCPTFIDECIFNSSGKEISRTKIIATSATLT